MAQHTPNYGLEMPEATDDFKDFRNSYNGNMVIIDNNMGGGGGSGGHTIYDEAGNALPQESGMQFTGAVTVSDDSGNGRTVVNIESGGGTYNLNTIYSTEEKKVGYWTDNKPLYQKTWRFNSTVIINANTWTSLGIYEPTFEMKTRETLDDEDRPNTTLFCTVRNGYVSAFSDVAINVQTITIWYTKTTDTPEPNPQVGNVIYLPTIYTEEEREVGVWRDGKPVYQRTFVLPSPLDISSSSWTGTGQYISNGENIIFCQATANDGTTTPLMAYLNNGEISCQTPRNGTSWSIQFLTLQYTKTTDTAGSGTWTPSGATAVHYSTNEQVIGTWIDGKPLYQRTWDNLTVPITANTWANTGISATDIETIVDGTMQDDNKQKISGTIGFMSSNTYIGVNPQIGNRNLESLTVLYTKTTD